MYSRKLLTGVALGLCLLCTPVFASAADADKTVAPVPAANVPAGVDTAVLTIMPPETDIVITFPLILVERGTVESMDAKAGIFELKRKDGTLAKIMVNDNTIVENVYADIFTWESKKGIGDLKKGDRVRARVFPPQSNGVESALLVDVFHF